jgi:RimJ/RimL family protein N-acetyltransferase
LHYFDALKMLDYNFHIDTTRLTVSYLNPNNHLHIKFVFDLNNSPEMLALNKQMSSSCPDLAASRAFIDKGTASLEEKGYGRYLVSLRPKSTASPHILDDGAEAADVPFSEIINTHNLIGILSMQCQRFPSGPTIPDVGFAILAKYYGNGYATEATQGLMRYHREERGCRGFFGFCNPAQERPMKMFQRMGFEDRGVREVDGLVGEGELLKCAVWSLGVEGDLKGYGV